MVKLDEAREILNAIDMPTQQQTDICCYSLLTLAQIEPDKPWRLSTNAWIRIHDVIEFTASKYDKHYAENTRETIRKHCMHQFRDAALIEDNGKSTNSPNYRYRLTPEAVNLLRAYNTHRWSNELAEWHRTHTSLIELYTSKKRMTMMTVNFNGEQIQFSSGPHNLLQRAILEEFAPRFAPGCTCLYVGDTIKKDLIKDSETLSRLGFDITLHDKMPDVVLYCADKDWIYFIEAVTSVGPMSPKRIREIEAMTENVSSGKIYVTAFLNMVTFKRFAETLAWETEVWVANMPDHMIHLNGDRFMGPR